jgi:hypothetical protein
MKKIQENYYKRDNLRNQIIKKYGYKFYKEYIYFCINTPF